ncbi:TraX family protein [Chroogloeocystis siderophila 5.2 s.c.1]|uniref:TraX family protein n=1 Tax=Chroogloeocystis siderophila 5.2 s.c.1 TaxID=247279 RepID=A0A1U7HCA3_9CHRO|nr:TraX family protein [Chroogloeocystis siderophila 5.2 s.c.1]
MQLNNYHIKLLAAIFMVIDHVGIVFFPQVFIFRVIGRLSFPLFAWLLAQGERYTRSFGRYLQRLVLLGLLSQPLYVLTLSGTRLNILFTLSLGLIILRLSRRLREYKYLIWTLGIVSAELVRVEYGAYGVAAMCLLSIFTPNLHWWLAWIGLHLVDAITVSNIFQLPAIVTPVFIHFANHQRGSSARWFYSFYPLHLLVLFLIFRLSEARL